MVNRGAYRKNTQVKVYADIGRTEIQCVDGMPRFPGTFMTTLDPTVEGTPHGHHMLTGQ